MILRVSVLFSAPALIWRCGLIKWGLVGNSGISVGASTACYIGVYWYKVGYLDSAVAVFMKTCRD